MGLKLPKLKLPAWKWILAIKLFLATRKAAKTKTATLENDKKVVETWLADPDTKKAMLEIAQAFNQIFKGGWFGQSQVMKSTVYKTLPETMRILHTLKLAGLLLAEVRGEREVYKIVIGKEQRILALQLQEKKFEKQLTETRRLLKEVELE